VTAGIVALGAFLAMEGVSYGTHRWVMHGFALGWHRSHHAPPVARFERNDRFPLCFSLAGMALFLTASRWVPALWPVAVGVTGYGIAYVVVHDIAIHRRLRVPVPGGRYLGWLRDSHRDHHVGGGEPYGMLLPLVRGRPRRARGEDPLDRNVRG
jgi:beta-carotene 3-hydroxylase